jgi:hypothetical protein
MFARMAPHVNILRGPGPPFAAVVQVREKPFEKTDGPEEQAQHVGKELHH